MKKAYAGTKRLSAILLVLALSLSLIPTALAAPAEWWEFDGITSYVDKRTVVLNGKDLVYDIYQVTYVDTTTQFWDDIDFIITGTDYYGNPTSLVLQDCLKMNIKVPISYDGVIFDSYDTMPVVFNNPWGGDSGRGVTDGMTETVSASGIVAQALMKGWVTAEPGMRGINFIDDDGYNWGKLPEPLVDLKAALRYLHVNDAVIPGDMDKIVVTGTSSGGAATVMLGITGNTDEWDEYLDTIGAYMEDGARDDIWLAGPSCPIVMRDHADTAIAWQRFFGTDFSSVDTAGATADELYAFDINQKMVAFYEDYQSDLGIMAGATQVTADNMHDAYLPYMKTSIIKYLNNLADRDAIETYLEEARGNATRGLVTRSDFLEPVYGVDGETVIDLVIDDVDAFYNTFYSYLKALGSMFSQVERLDYFTMDFEYDRAFTDPNITAQGTSTDSAYWALANRSVGKGDDSAGTHTPFGLANARNAVTDPDYLALYELQSNSVNPMYWLDKNQDQDYTDIAPYWFIRTGALDDANPFAMYFNFATALSNAGYNVDAALTWDQGHGITNEIAEFFDYVETALVGEPEHTVTLDANGGTVASTTLTTTGGKLTSLPTPVRTGYDFKGWFTSASGGLRVDTTYSFVTDVKIYAQWTTVGAPSSNSGGTSGGVTNNVAVGSAANGKITVSSTNPAKGDSVTVTVTPNAGYKLNALTITNKSGSKLGYTDNGDGTYTFIYGGETVTIEAEFVPLGEVPSTLPFTDVRESDWYYDAVRYVIESGLMSGVSSTMFSPGTPMTRAMLVTVLYRCEDEPAVSSANPFTDVPDGQWYTDAVKWAAANDIVNGYGNGEFGPDDNVTREQMVAIFLRYADFKGLDISASAALTGYGDAGAVSDWALDSMQWAVAAGLIQGRTETDLVPGGISTRAEVATVIMRFIENFMNA